MDYAVARRRMVENQIRPNRIVDPLLVAAMATLPREMFVPDPQRGIAYVDEDIPLGGGRHLLAPLTMAQLVQAADIGASDVVLNIGCGPGYMAAVIAQLAGAVVALDCDQGLLRKANDVLRDLAVDLVTVVEGPLQRGWSDQAPYDAIVFGGAVVEIPEAIPAQLADGGRMVAVLADGHGVGKGTVFLKAGGVLSRRTVFDCFTPLLPDSPRADIPVLIETNWRQSSAFIGRRNLLAGSLRL